jgi:hypothetical protein
MTKSTNTNTVRLFGRTGAAEATRPTIDTPSGPIYAGTEQASQYLALKAWVAPVIALSNSFGTMAFEKAQTIKDIATIQGLIAEGESGVRATLADLSEALQGRVSDHSGMRFDDPGLAFKTHVETLRHHANRCAFGMGYAHQSAPRPPRPDETPAPVGQPLGTGYRERNQ